MHLVGVGNQFRGDDAVGLAVAARLRRKLGPHPRPGLTLHAPADNPELLISRLCTSGGRVVIVDAVEASRDPGTIVCASLKDTKYGFFATHNIPLRLLPGVSGGDVWLVGVEPESLEVGAPLSASAEASASLLVDALCALVEAKR